MAGTAKPVVNNSVQRWISMLVIALSSSDESVVAEATNTLTALCANASDPSQLVLSISSVIATVKSPHCKLQLCNRLLSLVTLPEVSSAALKKAVQGAVRLIGDPSVELKAVINKLLLRLFARLGEALFECTHLNPAQKRFLGQLFEENF